MRKSIGGELQSGAEDEQQNHRRASSAGGELLWKDVQQIPIDA